MRPKTERRKGTEATRRKGKKDSVEETKQGKGIDADASSPFPLSSSSPDASSSQASSSSRARTVRRTSVAIVGAGRLGTALARALAACGYDVVAVVARRPGHARRAAAATGTSQTRALSAAQLDRLPPTDILIITTPDDLITDVAARLAASIDPSQESIPPPVEGGSGRRSHPPTTADGTDFDAVKLKAAKSNTTKRAGGGRRVALHASGALSSDALAALGERGFAVGSMHPLVAVSDGRGGAESLRGAFYCLEGERVAVGAARKLVRALGGRSFSINTADKSLYHAAAVMASGHAVALFDIASELLARCGLPASEARRILMPLVRSTLENLSTQTPRHALTGTFARADAATVHKHLAALRRPPTREALAAYVLLGQHSLRLAERNGADAGALREIARELEKAEGGKRQAEGGEQ